MVVAALTIASWKWGQRAMLQVRILYWQQQCMRYSSSPDTVVYEEEPPAAAALLTDKALYRAYVLNRSRPPSVAVPSVNAAAAQPVCETRFRASWAGVANTNLGQLGGVLGAASAKSVRAIAFIHERRSPGGHRRLVIVAYTPEANTFTPGFIEGYNYSTLAITPATLLAPPSIIPRGWDFDVLSGWPRHPPMVRMYAGQPDPRDASHFTIRYQMWGQEDILDGRLDDSDDVTLTPRHLPEEPRP
jgi:hypothetical protein